MVKLIYREADLKRRLAGRPAAGLSDLVADAASPDEFRRYASACGLARFKDPAAPAAAAALLDDPSGAVRRAALEAIKTQARVAGPAVIDKLVAMLEADDPRSRLLRQGVAEALAAQGEAVVPAMARCWIARRRTCGSTPSDAWRPPALATRPRRRRSSPFSLLRSWSTTAICASRSSSGWAA